MTVSARACALEVLLGLQRGRTFASELLDRESGLKGLDPRERALAREIVYGVERHLRTLRHLVRAKCDVALEAIAPPVLAILLIGAYQILFLERIPPHAAVSATVDLARGVICSLRHIHMSPADALEFALRDGDIVRVQVEGPRSLIFGDVLVRVHPEFRLELHLDTDEANAAEISPGMVCHLDSIQERPQPADRG